MDGRAEARGSWFETPFRALPRSDKDRDNTAVEVIFGPNESTLPQLELGIHYVSVFIHLVVVVVVVVVVSCFST